MHETMAERSPDPRAPSFSIVGFNIHYGTDRQERPFDVEAVCASFDADVIALQEVFWPDGDRCWTDGLRNRGYEVVGLPLCRVSVSPTLKAHADQRLNTGSWGVAIASRLPMTASEEIPIGRTPFDPAGERRALRVHVETGGSSRISVTNLHASPLVPLGLFHHVRLARGIGRPQRSVVVGDFNMWGPPVGLVFRRWQRPVRGRSFPARRPHSQIDHLIASQDLVVEEAQVLGDVGSDHRPIRARLRTTDGREPTRSRSMTQPPLNLRDTGR